MRDKGKNTIPQGKSDDTKMDSSSPLFFKAGEMILKEGNHGSCAYRIEVERHHRQFSALNREELSLVSQVASTGIQLQNVFKWNDAFKIISESLNTIGFKTLDLQIETGKAGGRDLVDLLAHEKKGDTYRIHFHGANRSGTLLVQTPSGKRLRDCYRGFLMLYNELLSSCLAKNETYETFKNISEYVENYMSDMRIQEMTDTLKEAIEKFSTRNLDIFMSIPERLNTGEKIEDIAFELTIGFQEIDRFAQEVDLIQKVLTNILNIIKGQLPTSVDDYDRNIDKIGGQSAVDTILSDQKNKS